jgi:hypothetical protein
MSSLYDLIKNRPFIPRYKVQTDFFLSKDIHSSQNTAVSATPSGGAERDRTADPLLAKQVLSQLSYSPNLLVIDEASFAMIWWAWEDLNFRPHAYQACALTN